MIVPIFAGLEDKMNDTNQEPKTGDALVENIGHRDHLPVGWRRIYDELIVDLYKLGPDLRVSLAKSKLGELRVHLEQSGCEQAHALIAKARLATQAAVRCAASPREGT